MCNNTIDPHQILTIVGAWPSIMGWMHLLNSDDDVAVPQSDGCAPSHCSNGTAAVLPLPFWIKNNKMVNKGVKNGYLCWIGDIIAEKSINCLKNQLRV